MKEAKRERGIENLLTDRIQSKLSLGSCLIGPYVHTAIYKATSNRNQSKVPVFLIRMKEAHK